MTDRPRSATLAEIIGLLARACELATEAKETNLYLHLASDLHIAQQLHRKAVRRELEAALANRGSAQRTTGRPVGDVDDRERRLTGGAR